MAETLTYDAGTDTVTDGSGEELTPAEQDSLAVGEALVDSQDKLLAGKYEDAQALEKAYIELQRKLGEDGKEAVPPEAQVEVEQEEVLPETSEEKSEEPSGTAELINSASDEFAEKGELTAETLDRFSEISSRDLVQAFAKMQAEAVDTAELTDAVIADVKGFAGGDQAYSDIVGWAGENLDQGSIDAFDNIVNSGSVEAIKLAVSGLKSQYEIANGYEGKMVAGKTPQTSKDTYRSQAELVAAMADRRYDRDPAYRQDVLEKLARSDNVQF